MGFKEGIVTSDFQNIVVLAADKGHHREALHIFNAKTGATICKLPLKQAGVKVCIVTWIRTTKQLGDSLPEEEHSGLYIYTSYKP